jgi:putative intracellular protease/amidase
MKKVLRPGEVAIFVAKGFLPVGLTEPRASLDKAGFETGIASPNFKTVNAAFNSQTPRVLGSGRSKDR